MAKKVAVVDYGMGNLRSVLNAFHAVGAEARLVTVAEELKGEDKILLPGVGAFAEAIAHLTGRGFDLALNEARQGGAEILGICLGMQLMCTLSEEDGEHRGLGWMDAAVRRFPNSLGVKIPHIGWNDLEIRREHYLLDGLSPHPDVYFVHSYRVECNDSADVVAACDYGEPFTAIFARENIMGIQFHPEKSQAVGLRILKNFVEHRPC